MAQFPVESPLGHAGGLERLCPGAPEYSLRLAYLGAGTLEVSFKGNGRAIASKRGNDKRLARSRVLRSPRR